VLAGMNDVGVARFGIGLDERVPSGACIVGCPVTISGWAVDLESNACAASVAVVLSDAAYVLGISGLPRRRQESNAAPTGVERPAFRIAFSTSHLEPRPHDLELVVVTSDGSGYARLGLDPLDVLANPS
jgi:hypothetical protein